jgi:putative ATPase
MRPLAERMRPQNIDDFIGQDHIVGQDAVLRQALDSGNIPSFILWGPPGVGKTSLSHIISTTLKRPFYALSAINSGVKEVRETIEKARKQQFFDRPNPILFIDEIHRFSKSQQDSLLGAVEKGIITLIGATTENPSFEVIPALLSRCQVYVMKELTKENLITLINKAVAEDEHLSSLDITIVSYDALLRYSGGDARRLLNSLEIVCNAFPKGDKIKIDDDIVKKSIQQNIALYDKSGEQHYDVVSAFIKSIRGSDPQAAVYYLARMVEGGEDPRFICRRMIIAASEDIGLANPNALLLANACFSAVHNIGMPEGRIIMSQCAIYLATSPKSNSAYLAIRAAQSEVKKSGNLSIPLPLRNAPTQLMKSLDYGKNYQYAHDYDKSFVEMEYLPKEISGSVFFTPGKNPHEEKISNHLKQLWKSKYQ